MESWSFTDKTSVPQAFKIIWSVRKHVNSRGRYKICGQTTVRREEWNYLFVWNKYGIEQKQFVGHGDRHRWHDKKKFLSFLFLPALSVSLFLPPICVFFSSPFNRVDPLISTQFVTKIHAIDTWYPMLSFAVSVVFLGIPKGYAMNTYNKHRMYEERVWRKKERKNAASSHIIVLTSLQPFYSVSDSWPEESCLYASSRYSDDKSQQFYSIEKFPTNKYFAFIFANYSCSYADHILYLNSSLYLSASKPLSDERTGTRKNETRKFPVPILELTMLPCSSPTLLRIWLTHFPSHERETRRARERNERGRAHRNYSLVLYLTCVFRAKSWTSSRHTGVLRVPSPMLLIYSFPWNETRRRCRSSVTLAFLFVSPWRFNGDTRNCLPIKQDE